ALACNTMIRRKTSNRIKNETPSSLILVERWTYMARKRSSSCEVKLNILLSPYIQDDEFM
ncbi:MAG: hypothetical protein WBC96_13270, partial [Thermodesulfobacteriota bacterium]